MLPIYKSHFLHYCMIISFFFFSFPTFVFVLLRYRSRRLKINSYTLFMRAEADYIIVYVFSLYCILITQSNCIILTTYISYITSINVNVVSQNRNSTITILNRLFLSKGKKSNDGYVTYFDYRSFK